MNHRGLTCLRRRKGLLLPPPPARAKLFRFIFINSALGLDSKGEPFAADIRVSYFQKVKNDQAVKKMWNFCSRDLVVSQRDGSHQWWYFWWREKPLRGCGGLKPGDAHILLLLLLDIEILALVLRWLRCWSASGRSARQAHKWIHFSLAPSHGRAQCPSTQP